MTMTRPDRGRPLAIYASTCDMLRKIVPALTRMTSLTGVGLAQFTRGEMAGLVPGSSNMHVSGEAVQSVQVRRSPLLPARSPSLGGSSETLSLAVRSLNYCFAGSVEPIVKTHPSVAREWGALRLGRERDQGRRSPGPGSIFLTAA